MEHRTDSDLRRADFPDPVAAMKMQPNNNQAVGSFETGHLIGARYGAPGAGDTGYAKGALFVDADNGLAYVNKGTPAVPDWKEITTAA